MAMATLNVTLVPTNNPSVIDVDESGNANVIKKNAKKQHIHWRLRGNASSGEFMPLTGANPGFAWASSPPPPGPPPIGIFSDPKLSPKRKSLTIDDTHKDATSDGEWSYQLSIKVNGVVYQTILTSAKQKTKAKMLITTNPTIKNN
jgi:hypothetical protein